MKLLTKLSVFVLLLLSPFAAHSQTCADLNGAYVVGQDSGDTYLGFFGSRFASESIMNEFGAYGSPFRANSVRNTFGTFGNSTSSFSAQNSLASFPPRIFRRGVFVAYLSTNVLRTPRVTLSAIDASCSFTALSPDIQGPPPPPPITRLFNNTPVNGSTNSTATFLDFKDYGATVPAGQGVLTVTLTNLSGDVDLLVRFGSLPTGTVYDCRSIRVGVAQEVCQINSPAAGDWFFTVVGFDNGLVNYTITASWGAPPVAGVDEPRLTSFMLPTPNPPNQNCPAGYFTAAVVDGPGTGLSPGTWGMEILLDQPGTRALEGGLNFGGLVDRGQVGFAGFNIANAANENQRLNIDLTGSSSTSSSQTLFARVKVERESSPGSRVTVFEQTTNIGLSSPFRASFDVSPGYYVATVEPLSGNVGGAPEGQFFFSMTTSFVNRPGGGFQGGAVVGGYHSTHPFGGVSGFAGFCISTQHRATIRTVSAPSYGAAGARDLRLRLLDDRQQLITTVP